MKLYHIFILAAFAVSCSVSFGAYDLVAFAFGALALLALAVKPSLLFSLMPFTSIVYYKVLGGDEGYNLTINDMMVGIIYVTAGLSFVYRSVSGRSLRMRGAGLATLLPIITIACLVWGSLAAYSNFGLEGATHSAAVFGKQWAIYCLLPLAGLMLLKDDSYKHILLATVYAGVALGVTLIFDVPDSYLEAIGGWEAAFNVRKGGLLYNPNVTATFLMISILVLLIDRNSYIIHPLLKIAFLAFLFISLLLTGTRGIVLVLMMVVVAIYFKEIVRGGKVYVAFYISSVVVLAFLLMSDVGSNLVDRFSELDSQSSDQSAFIRLVVQAEGLALIAEEPMGLGPGNLMKVDALSIRYLGTTDNLFIDTFISFGWFGGLLFMAFVFIPMAYKGLGYRRLVISVISAIALAGFVYSSFFFPSAATAYWIIMAIGVYAHREPVSRRSASRKTAYLPSYA